MTRPAISVQHSRERLLCQAGLLGSAQRGHTVQNYQPAGPCAHWPDPETASSACFRACWMSLQGGWWASSQIGWTEWDTCGLNEISNGSGSVQIMLSSTPTGFECYIGYECLIYGRIYESPREESLVMWAKMCCTSFLNIFLLSKCAQSPFPRFNVWNSGHAFHSRIRGRPQVMLHTYLTVSGEQESANNNVSRENYQAIKRK